MNLQQITEAVNAGIPVYWKNKGYQVKPNSKNSELLISSANGHSIGLTRTDGTTLNGKEEDFFTNPAEPLAKEFSAQIAEWLTPDQLKESIRRNAEPEYAGCDATHDFCDANVAMILAFQRIVGREIDHHSDSDNALLNNAWDLAKKNNYFLAG